jgi:ATP-dependent RNA helicase DDX55/SPB4
MWGQLSYLLQGALRVAADATYPDKQCRELASQIHKVLLSLLAFHGPSFAAARPTVLTDVSAGGQIEAQKQFPATYPASTPKVIPQLLVSGSTTSAQDLSAFLRNSPNLLISTPGRLLEILSSPYVHCPQSTFEILVLDEADRLLDLGFKQDLTKIMSRLPKQRRTGLFSASVSEAVDQIIRVGLRNPVRIAVKVKGANGAEDKRTPASLQMAYSLTPPTHKFPALSKLLHKLDPVPSKTIVYLSSCAAVDYFQSLLPSILPTGMVLVPLHGKHPSNVRQKNFIRFTNSVTPALLLTTDVAARGLDIPAVDLVVQVDPPSDPKVFLHRCGRAGRAGRKGLSVVFLQPGREEDYISFLEVRKTPIEKLLGPDISVTDEDAARVTSKFRGLVLRDRAHHDKAQKAVVSWVRSYSKHQASSIFRVADLDWTELAEAWGLLKMPKMPELKGWDRGDHQKRRPAVDWDEYAYKDRQREKQRKDELEDFRKNGPSLRPDMENKKKRGVSVAWSANMERKADKEARRSRKEAKRGHEQSSKMTPAEKEELAETERMVELVREHQLKLRAEQDREFEGFD